MLAQSDNRNMQKRYSIQAQRQRGIKPTHKSLIAWHIIAAFFYLYYTRWGCEAKQIPGSKFLDLSHPFDESTIYWVTAKQFDLTITHNGTDPTGQYWVQSDEISAGTHGGTHMDAPCHFALGRWCVSDVPLEKLIVSAVVVDISHDVQDNPKVHLTKEHLKDWEKMHGQIPDGSLLFVRTGWSRYWPIPLRYSGTNEKNADLLKFPSITADAAYWLEGNRNIVGIGIDTMSIDIPSTGTKEVHTKLLKKNIYALENVNLLDPLPPKGLKAYVMPMKIKDASGAPCRVLVEVSKDALNNGNIGTGNSVSLVWTAALLVAFAWTFS